MVFYFKIVMSITVYCTIYITKVKKGGDKILSYLFSKTKALHRNQVPFQKTKTLRYIQVTFWKKTNAPIVFSK